MDDHSLEVNRPKCRPGSQVDEWAGFVQTPLNGSPLTHHHLELVPCPPSLLTGKGDHPGTTRPDGLDLSSVMLDAAISGDDQPTVASGLGYPNRVIGGGLVIGQAGRARLCTTPPGSPG